MKHNDMAAIERLIVEIRTLKVILDSDLARIYGVPTKRLNEQVKRNSGRFPDDFMFQLTLKEKAEVVANCDHLGQLKFSPVLPFAFTEYGAVMAANVLNSPEAIRTSVFIVRAFVNMRMILSDGGRLTRKIAQLERELKGRLDVHDAVIVTILQRVMDLLDPPPRPEPPKRRIGF